MISCRPRAGQYSTAADNRQPRARCLCRPRRTTSLMQMARSPAPRRELPASGSSCRTPTWAPVRCAALLAWMELTSVLAVGGMHQLRKHRADALALMTTVPTQFGQALQTKPAGCALSAQCSQCWSAWPDSGQAEMCRSGGLPGGSGDVGGDEVDSRSRVACSGDLLMCPLGGVPVSGVRARS